MATEKTKVDSSSTIPEGQYTVVKVNELNFFDLSGEKAGTKGTSNKMYHAELQVSTDGTRAQIMTMFGPTGTIHRKDYRSFANPALAEKEYEKILKSKRKKGYKDIDVAQRSLGSDESKKITKAVTLKNAQDLIVSVKSTITDDQAKIVDIFFGSQAHFVATTLKCPLGQLTNKQIDDGRNCLDEAKKIVNAARKPNGYAQSLLELTNDFYGLIPHNLGSGSRGQMSHLLLDDLTKIMEKENDLDTLLDAKQVNAVLKADSGIDDKYKSLNCDFEGVPKGSALFEFISSYFEGSKVRNHGYDSIRVANIWKMRRNDDKEQAFIKNAKKIAKASGTHHFVSETSKRGGKNIWTPSNRPDLDADEKQILTDSNSWLCWHGTRSANLVGITRRGLLIRPAGAVHTGSLMGDGKYFAWQSTKSLNYCDGGYWTGGHQNNSKFMFMLDVSLGNMHRCDTPKFFKSPPAGYHSVYAKAGAYLKNDEMITYDIEDHSNQSTMKYILELR